MTQLIRTLLIASLALFIGGCDYLSSCPLEVGDRVVELDTGKEGEVRALKQFGRATENCRVVVFFDDGTWSNRLFYDKEQDVYYTSKHIYAWTLKKIED